ncbi:SphA family protein [Bosea sp. NPDC055353]
MPSAGFTLIRKNCLPDGSNAMNSGPLSFRLKWMRALASFKSIALGMALALSGTFSAANATEGGASLYLPGFHGPMAGYLPPPGFYFETDLYSYSGRTSARIRTQIGGAVLGNVRVEARAGFLTPTWVLPVDIFGGNLAIGASLPVGVPRVSAGVVVSSPRLGRTIGISERDATFNIGDPIVSAVLGWHADKFHWATAAAVSIPAGAYQEGELSNLAFNRWIGDVSASLTYLDPAIGLDISTTLGFEINGRNNATDYKSGNAFHADLAVTKNLTKEWSIGLLVGHYQQIIDDSGGDVLVGSHKGRVTAVGGSIGYNFEVGGVPIAARLKVMREVEVANRAQGTMGLLSIAFPLWTPPKTGKSGSI